MPARSLCASSGKIQSRQTGCCQTEENTWIRAAESTEREKSSAKRTKPEAEHCSLGTERDDNWWRRLSENPVLAVGNRSRPRDPARAPGPRSGGHSGMLLAPTTGALLNLVSWTKVECVLAPKTKIRKKMFGGENQIGISEPGRAKNKQRKSMNKIGPTKIRPGLLPPRREMRGLTDAVHEQEKWIYITK
jgi:hypothetical protein